MILRHALQVALWQLQNTTWVKAGRLPATHLVEAGAGDKGWPNRQALMRLQWEAEKSLSIMLNRAGQSLRNAAPGPYTAP